MYINKDMRVHYSIFDINQYYNNNLVNKNNDVIK
jgi:hypothetical protein